MLVSHPGWLESSRTSPMSPSSFAMTASGIQSSSKASCGSSRPSFPVAGFCSVSRRHFKRPSWKARAFALPERSRFQSARKWSDHGSSSPSACRTAAHCSRLRPAFSYMTMEMKDDWHPMMRRWYHNPEARLTPQPARSSESRNGGRQPSGHPACEQSRSRRASAAAPRGETAAVRIP